MNRYLSTACLCFVFSVAVVAQDSSSLGANKISGQILVSHAGKIQKTGLAPIWVYDATNSQLTASLTLPDFGRRGRKDWERIVAVYTNSLNVYSNYEQLSQLPPRAQSNRVAVAEEYLARKQELNGKTSGPDFEAVQQLEAKFKKALLVDYQSWDRMNDEAES